MPYIKKQDRKKFLKLLGIYPETPGELNYCFTVLALNYLTNKKENYQIYNDIIGALENSKLELYRRKISNYENKKIKENGDVY